MDQDLKTANESEKPVLSVKFDGVLHDYESRRWQNAKNVVLGPPVPGSFTFLERALDFFTVCVVGERNVDPLARRALWRWFKRHGWPREDRRPAQLLFPGRVPESFMVIDDRCYLFTGEFPDPELLTRFTSWKGT